MSCKQNTTTTIIKSNDENIDTGKKAGEVDHYICYRENDINDLELSVSFDTYGNALEVKYKGQEKGQYLIYLDEVIITPGSEETKNLYTEVTDGIETGTYEFYRSDNSDHAKYIRAKDGEVFKFTINNAQTIIGGRYRGTPCF